MRNTYIPPKTGKTMKRHQKQTKTFAELNFAQKTKSMTITFVNFQRMLDAYERACITEGIDINVIRNKRNQKLMDLTI